MTDSTPKEASDVYYITKPFHIKKYIDINGIESFYLHARFTPIVNENMRIPPVSQWKNSYSSVAEGQRLH